MITEANGFGPENLKGHSDLKAAKINPRGTDVTKERKDPKDGQTSSKRQGDKAGSR